MLCWICPECGHECSPSVRDCPTCAASGSAGNSSVSAQHADENGAGVVQLLHALESATDAPFESADSEIVTCSAPSAEACVNGHASEVASSCAVAEEALPVVELNGQLSASIVQTEGEPAAPLVSVECRQSAERPTEINDPVHELVQASSSVEAAEAPAPIAAPPVEAPPVTSLAVEAPPVETPPVTSLAMDAPAVEAPPAAALAVEAPAVDAPSVASLAVEAPAVDAPPVASLAMEAPAVEAPPVASQAVDAPAVDEPIDTPPNSPDDPTPGSLPDTAALAEELEKEAQVLFEAITPQPQPDEAAAEICQALESEAELVLDSIAQQLETDRAGIQGILASFSQRPGAYLLEAPAEIVTPPAPAAVERIRTPRPRIEAASLNGPELAPLTNGPPAPTLDGPCLPPQLKSFALNTPVRLEKSSTRSGFPTWIVSFLIALAVLLGLVRATQFANENRDASAAATPPKTTRAVSHAPPAVLEQHPFARFVEVAGVRVTPGSNRKLQLEYIVVNHSSRELTGLGIRLALKSTDDSSGAPPLFTTYSKIPSLGANQSREIRTELETGPSAAAPPDWQSLRSEVVVSQDQ